MNISPMQYLLILSIILGIVIIAFSVYLWKKIKGEKEYLTEALPDIEELKPEDLIRVTTYSKDNTPLPTIEEIEESYGPVTPVKQLLQEDNKVTNPFDSL